MRPVARIAFALVCAALAGPAAASFHLMRIVQVYGGDVAHPDAQYVVLQMCTGNQNLVNGHSIYFFDNAGAQIGLPVTFTSPVQNGGSQSKILIGTSSFSKVYMSLLGDPYPVDLLMPASLAVGGGKVCFDPPPGSIDCFAWGSYTPIDPTVGAPYNSINGLEPGEAAQRDLAIVPPPTTLECVTTFDDTDDSASDFDPVAPAPHNNTGGTAFLREHVFIHGFENNSVAGWSAAVP